METLELIQKHPLKGRREFKLDDEEIHYIIDSPLRKDALSVALHVLDARPVLRGGILAFVSQVNGEPLVELFADRPDKKTFDHFIEALQQRITAEDFSRFCVTDNGVKVDIERLDESISQLKQYVDPAAIASLLPALFALRADPGDLQCQRKVAEALNELGFVQGQVIAYAPYFTYLFSANNSQKSFWDKE